MSTMRHEVPAAMPTINLDLRPKDSEDHSRLKPSSDAMPRTSLNTE